MLTDPIADMLTRIRNANKALHEEVEMPTSRLKEEVARILQEEGYITGYKVLSATDWRNKHKDVPEKRAPSFPTLVVELKYSRSRERIINGLRRVSKPGRRIYAGKDRLPRVPAMGISILSTSRGVITGRRAAEEGVGGEVICFVW
jgi:small subunit ribosomal protein S8